jgi:hypothetical protein
MNNPGIVMATTIIDPAANLLRSPYLQVQYEGFELLQELAKRQNLQDLIILHLVTILRKVVDENADEKEVSKYNQFNIYRSSTGR